MSDIANKDQGPVAVLVRRFGAMLARRDRVALGALIGLPLLAAFLIPNPYDSAGFLDPYIYTGYTLNFSELVNRYGPYYFSYRLAHIAPLWFFHTFFDDGLGFALLRMAECAVILGSIWVIFRPHLPRFAVIGLGAATLFSPWTLKIVSTLYVDGTCVPALFGLTALLVRLTRTEFGAQREAIAAGALGSLICNANLSLLPFVAILFVAFFAPALGRIPLARLARAALAVLLAGLAAQALIYVLWVVLMMASGAPLSLIFAWTGTSLAATAWDIDMFSFVVGRAMANHLSGEPTPEILRMLRGGETHVLAPLALIVGAAIYRVWANPLTARPEDAPIRRDVDPILIAAALTLAYAIVSTETLGNHVLNVSFYIAYLAPSMYLAAAGALALIAPATMRDGERLSAATIAALVAGGAVVAAFLLNLAAPTLLYSALQQDGAQAMLTWGLVALTLAFAVPLMPARARVVVLAAALTFGSLLFLATNTSGASYWRSVYHRELAASGRDMLDAQRAIRDFVNRYAPTRAAPNGRPVLFWHDNDYFIASTQSGYLANNSTLHLGSGSTPMPDFDQRAVEQLSYGERRDIVLLSQDAATVEAAKAALTRIGARFTERGAIVIRGRVHTIHATMIHIDTPPPYFVVEGSPTPPRLSIE